MSILEQLISQDFTLTNESGKYVRTVEHDSLVLDREADVFYWNSQGLYGNAFQYLVKVRGMSSHEARDILGISQPEEEIFKSNCQGDVWLSNVDEEIVIYPRLVDIFYEYGKDFHDYWHSVRGYTDRTIDRFKLGFTGDWYVIPIFVQNRFRNFQARKFLSDGKKIVRNWYRGLGPLPFNFSILKLTDWVVITEGPVDAIMLRQNDIPAISHTSGATYWNPDWNIYFGGMKRIYIVYDNDSAGNTSSVKLGEQWGNRAKIYNFWDFDSKFDVTDYFKSGGNSEDFLKLLNDKAKAYYEIEI